MVDNDKKVAAEHVFHFKDGKKAHNIKDLRNVIDKMQDDIFSHHVDDVNNDFANWIEFVYKKPDLADDLRKVNTQKRMVELLDVELGSYGGESFADEPVEEEIVSMPEKEALEKVEPPKQLHEDPVKLSEVPQTIDDVSGEKVHSISTKAPHTFIIKEFFYGVITGILLGIIIMGVLLRMGVL